MTEMTINEVFKQMQSIFGCDSIRAIKNGQEVVKGNPGTWLPQDGWFNVKDMNLIVEKK